jgi:hypothetical protein
VVVGKEADAEDVGAECVDAEGEGGVRELKAGGGMGAGGEGGGSLGGEEGGEGRAEEAGGEKAARGGNEAGGKHKSRENRFYGVIAMQGASTVAHFCLNR